MYCFVFINKYCLTVFVNERKLLSKLVHSVYACDKHLPVDVDMKSIKISMSILTVDYINNVCNMKHMCNVGPHFQSVNNMC